MFEILGSDLEVSIDNIDYFDNEAYDENLNSYSLELEVKNKLLDEDAMIVSPNPFQDYLDVKLSSKENKDAILTVLNSQGQQILSNVIKIQEGRNDFRLDMQSSEVSMSSGVYFIQIIGENLHEITQIIHTN